MLTATARVIVAASLGAALGAVDPALAQAPAGRQAAPPAPPPQLSALAPANLAKPRPKAPFDLTGTWRHDGRWSTWRFVPETVKLTPPAQVHYDASQQALKLGQAIATTSVSAGPPACRSS